MKVILVDDELWTMDQFEHESRDLAYVEVTGRFENPQDALAFAAQHEVNAALLDVEMPQMSGIELGKKLRALQKDMVLIYISGYEKYISEAMLLVKADYYLLKPYNREEVQDVLQRAYLLSARQKKRVEIRTFGHFDVFVNGKVLPFANAKAKELLALCVDQKGGLVTMERAVSVLWEDREYDTKVKSLYRKAVIYIHSILREAGAEEVFVSNRGSCHVDCNAFSCDYYRYLEDGESSGVKFEGEYLYEYSWAEVTTAKLCLGKKTKKLEKE